MAITGKHGLMVVEDCAQAHMTPYKGRKCGTIGDVGCFSLQQTNHVTAGEGGVVIARADSLRGRAPQLRRLDQMIEARRRSAVALSSAIGAADGVTLPPEVPWAWHTYFACQFSVDPGRFTVGGDRLVEAIRAEGVSVLPSYLPRPLYEYDFLANVTMYNQTRCPIACPLSHGTMDYRTVSCPGMNRCCSTGIFMPWNETITERMVRTMGAAFVRVLDHFRREGT